VPLLGVKPVFAPSRGYSNHQFTGGYDLKNKKEPSAEGLFLLCSDLLSEILYTAFADKLAFVVNEILALAAKQAVGLMLSEDDAVALNIDLNCILFCEIKGSSHFNRQYYSAEFIEFSDDAGGFHASIPPEMSACGGHCRLRTKK